MLPAARWFTAAGRRRRHGRPRPTTPTAPDGDRIGPEKCLFVYNANRNTIEDNRFEGCGIGIHFTAGAEGNAVAGNAFIGNRTQVKYVGTRNLDWSEDGRGNYWSDNPAFDLDGDGIADARLSPERHHRPGDVDRAAGAPSGHQPRRAGDPLGPVPLPRHAPGRRRRQRAADGPPASGP